MGALLLVEGDEGGDGLDGAEEAVEAVDEQQRGGVDHGERGALRVVRLHQDHDGDVGGQQAVAVGGREEAEGKVADGGLSVGAQVDEGSAAAVPLVRQPRAHRHRDMQLHAPP